MAKQRKAQTLVFENVLIFSIAVAIFILCYAVFTIYGGYFTAISVNDQLEGVSDFIVTNLIKVTESNADTFANLQIPERVGDTAYEIFLSDTGLDIETTGRGVELEEGYRPAHVHSNIYGLNETMDIIGGHVYSTKGRITLKKEGNQISIT